MGRLAIIFDYFQSKTAEIETPMAPSIRRKETKKCT